MPCLTFFSVFLRLNLITADKGFKIIQRYYCLVLDFFVHIVPVYFGFSAVSVNNFTVDSKTFQKTFGADVSSAFVLEFHKKILVENNRKRCSVKRVCNNIFGIFETADKFLNSRCNNIIYTVTYRVRCIVYAVNGKVLYL